MGCVAIEEGLTTGEIFAVVGQAGTGKTTWLMQQANDLAPRFLTAGHHRLLALTRMHGSRRRLQRKLLDSCSKIPCSISTIDGFALTLVDRWRRALGYSRPIKPVDGNTPFSDTIFGTEAGFSQILVAGTELLGSRTVRAVIRESYPLIVVDEFQDCHGALLDFVKALAICSTLIVAADDFQLLDHSVDGCPAVEWLRTTEGACNHCTRLVTVHRSAVQKILDAARCLRDNVPADAETIPIFCCAGFGPAAFKIVDALVYKASVWKGSTALIYPSDHDFVRQVLASVDHQLRKSNRRPMSWFRECSAQKEREYLRECLGLAQEKAWPNRWTAPTGDLPPPARQVVSRVLRFSRLRGIQDIPCEVVARCIDTAVHEQRAYFSPNRKRIVTTVHGAKNREFDNVIIIWPYAVRSDDEQNRRLLYNAITRSKHNCMLLVRGKLKRVRDDPVLSLLGPPREVFLSGGSRKPSRTMGRRK